VPAEPFAGGRGRCAGAPPEPFIFRGSETMKKTYASPTVVRHGNAVAMTMGRIGRLLEFINFRLG